MSKASTAKVEKLEKSPVKGTPAKPEKNATPAIETASAIDIVMPGANGVESDKPVHIESRDVSKPEGTAPEKGKTAKQQKQAAPESQVRPAEQNASDKAARKTKLVRHSFTLPKQEYALLGEVKKACRNAGIDVKKTELLRVSLGLLKHLDDVKLKAAIAALPPIKKQRQKKTKQT